MINEITKRKYTQLKYQVINIQKNINELQEYHKELIKKMRKTILIDDKVINEEKLDSIKKSEKQIINDLQDIINNINNKINE